MTIMETKQFPGRNPGRRPTTSDFPATGPTITGPACRPRILKPNQKKYAEARVEIQVASVLMHAWSEVEHDLVYKPLQGTLSDEELAILDELNGLVLAGEIALERLQSAGNERVKQQERSLRQPVRPGLLPLQLSEQQFPTRRTSSCAWGTSSCCSQAHHQPGDERRQGNPWSPFLRSVRFEKDRRNISQQIIDQIITGDDRRYTVYRELRGGGQEIGENAGKAVDDFFAQWIPLERFLNGVAYKGARKQHRPFNVNVIKRMNVLDQELVNQIVALRKVRNMLIHDIEIPETGELEKKTAEAKELLAKLREIFASADGGKAPEGR